VLREAIRRLPREQQDVVLRRLFTGCPFAEIAEAVGEGEVACRQRFLRGLRALRADLEREGIEG
jgi:DNA-directed RNA polymerase specialized sigma24 family protein